jgi:two-component system CheB/CheR fusion protein
MKAKGKQPAASRRSAAVRSVPAPAVAGQEFPIVGVGASAGGLEAFTRLLKRLPADTGMGFVLVQHLDPQHESALAQILARATPMPAHEVTNNLRVQANHVYVIPPNTRLGLAQGILKLQPRVPGRAAPRSIDFFLEALAQDRRERSIGVILSGTATDGTLGLEAIKAEGGITFSQDDSARYDSMPRSAISAGCVDFVLSPEAIAKELVRIARHPYVAGRAPRPEADETGGEKALPARGGGRGAAKVTGAGGAVEPRRLREKAGYQKILLLLRNHTGVDFSHYKSTTIHRRITRRTVLNRQDTLDHYAGFLRGNAKELDALYSDALISVTSFFRNAEAFAILRQKIFPSLLQQHTDEPLRVWVLGCSTGQEAYSIAIAFAEAAEKFPRARKLQVFATDLNEANLEKARHGLYAKSVAQDLSPERLRRFFVEEEGGYRVVKPLREQVVFARQNVISDPPFSRMDLISCRNLMIYLEPGLQKKVLPTFHYALKPDGFLFLGASESIGTFTHLFSSVDKKQKIFSKKPAPTPMFQLPLRQGHGGRPSPGQKPRALPATGAGPGALSDAFRGELNAEREADRVTLNQFAPPSVLIDAGLQILQFRGPTGAYLEPPTGKASFDLLKMAREGLMLPLRTAIHQAKREGKPARIEQIALPQNGKPRVVNVEVVPLKNLKECRYLVFFEEADRPGSSRPRRPSAETEPAPRPVSKREESSRIAGLERDLGETRDYLQSIQEQQEAANEELQAANEEGQSANEELQSLNEELETSKEELESTNEELTTVNEEMVSRNAELNRLNSDLINFQASTNLVIVLLGRDQTVRRFSAQAGKQFHLLASDLGRPIGSVRHNLDLPDLEAFVGEVIASVREREREVQGKDGHWYSLRVRPYVNLDNKVDGAVLVLMDIDELKRTERLITAAHEHAEAIIRTVPTPLVILSADLRLQSANPAFYRTFGILPSEAKGRSFFELAHRAWNLPRLRRLLKEVIPANRFFDGFEVTHTFDGIGRRSLLLNARRLDEHGGQPKEILLGLQDVTAVLEFETNLRRSELRYRRLFEASRDGILILNPVTRKITDANPFILNLLGYTRKQLLEKELWQIGLLKDEAANHQAFRELKRKGFIRYENLPLKAKSGGHHEVEFFSNLHDEDGVEVIQCNIRDITERKQSEEALRSSEERFRALFDLGPVGVYSCDLTGRIQEFNRRAVQLWGRKPNFGPRGDRFCGSFKMFHPNGRHVPHARCPMADVLKGKISSATDREIVVEQPTGTRLTIVVNIVPLKDKHGKITGAINCFYDITERKRAERVLAEARASLADYAGQLEKMVATRTAQLTAANRRLVNSVDSNRKGKEQYQRLFLESQAMQKKLRQLTHQIITAQENERKEISRELHDEVVQALVSINVELTALGRETAAGARPVRRKIARIQQQVENSVNAVHGFARELRPAVLDDLGLIPALHAYCKGVAERKKFKIKLTASRAAETLGSAGRTALFRVAQEALTNVGRHAEAALVRVRLCKIPGAIRLEVSDDGRSFHVGKTLQARNNKRLGLVGMKERVEMVGGSLTIESTPGKGTRVRADIPSPPRNHKNDLA